MVAQKKDATNKNKTGTKSQEKEVVKENRNKVVAVRKSQQLMNRNQNEGEQRK